MGLRRDVILTRAAAAAFGVTVALSLFNGVTELTAAIRGVVAACAATLVTSWLLRSLQGAVASSRTSAPKGPPAPR